MTAPLTAGNARVKEARKLHRRPERSGRRCFLADGPKAVEGALAEAGRVREVFATRAAAVEHAALLGDFTRHAGRRPRDGRAQRQRRAPPGVVAVCDFLDVPLPEALDGRLVALCADVRDPGNAGTVIRTARTRRGRGRASSSPATSVDLYNPKTIRASVGSAFHLPGRGRARTPAAAGACRPGRRPHRSWPRTAGESSTCSPPTTLLARPTAWLFGNEAWGLPDELAALADHRVSIPILGRAESLNLATAAAVCLYASARAMMAWVSDPLDLLPDGVVVADAQGRVTAINTVAAAMLDVGPAGQPSVARSKRCWPSPTTTARRGPPPTQPYDGLPTRRAVPEQAWLLPDGTEVLVYRPPAPRHPHRAGRVGRDLPALGPRPRPA